MWFGLRTVWDQGIVMQDVHCNHSFGAEGSLLKLQDGFVSTPLQIPCSGSLFNILTASVVGTKLRTPHGMQVCGFQKKPQSACVAAAPASHCAAARMARLVASKADTTAPSCSFSEVPKARLYSTCTVHKSISDMHHVFCRCRTRLASGSQAALTVIFKSDSANRGAQPRLASSAEGFRLAAGFHAREEKRF